MNNIELLELSWWLLASTIFSIVQRTTGDGI